MPQITNRKLVGEMGATPTGQGTVYSSMLKASSTNRERAARVNDSERKRLQKATGVIDKHNRQNQWMCDQEIERVRKSLARLDAYQRVLREEYPVKTLIGKTVPSRKNFTFKRKTAFSLLKSRSQNNAVTDSKGSISMTSSNPHKGELNLGGTQHDEATSDKKSSPETAGGVSVIIKGRNQDQNQSQNTVKRCQDSSQSINKEGVHVERHLPDAIDIVTTANTTFQRGIKLGHQVNSNDASTIRQNNHDSGKNNDTTIETKTHPPVLLVGDTHLGNELQKSEHVAEAVSAKTERKANNNININNHTTKKTRIPNTWFQKTDDKEQCTEMATGSKASSDVQEVCVEPEVTSHDQNKQERIKRLKAKWQTMMEARVCNRGFDMNTLRIDIDRKLKRMDVDRRHREVKKSLLEESSAVNDRIIRASKETFDKVIMETSSSKGKKTTDNTNQDMKLLPLTRHDGSLVQ